MMHLLYSMYLLCTSRRPFQQVLCYTSHIHTKNPDAQNHDSRPDTKVAVSAALYIMLHHRFALILNLLNCSCWIAIALFMMTLGTRRVCASLALVTGDVPWF